MFLALGCSRFDGESALPPTAANASRWAANFRKKLLTENLQSLETSMNSQNPPSTRTLHQQKINSSRDPWNPYRIFGMIVVLSSIVVGVLLGLNWKRLGKPQWSLKSILLSLLVNLGTIALALGWLVVFAGNAALPTQVMLLMPFIALGSNFGFAMALARLQAGAFKIYEKEGMEAIQDYEYDIQGAIKYGIIIIVCTVIFGIFILPAIG
jgi:hypothetical protein